MGQATSREMRSGYRTARLFGVTSPQSRSMSVVATIAMYSPPSPYRRSASEVEVTASATLTNSLPIRKVMIRLVGCWSMAAMRRPTMPPRSRMRSTWTVLSEKRAASDPEKKAEQTSRMAMSKSLTSSTLSNAASSKHHDPQAHADHTHGRERQQHLPGHVHQLIDPQAW